jgi:hypothetical protein
MARIALTSYLVLVTAAGPWLCCCPAGSAIASNPAAQHRHKAGPARYSGCHPGQPSKQSAGRAADHSPMRHSPCPYKQSRVEPWIVSEPVHAGAGEPGRLADRACSGEAGWLVLTFTMSTQRIHADPSGARSASCLHDPRDILRDLKIMRC